MASGKSRIESFESGFFVERRREPRFIYSTCARFPAAGGSIPGVVRNVSPDGLFVEIADNYTMGERLDIEFTLRSSRHIMNLTGEVVRKTPTGIGMKFL